MSEQEPVAIIGMAGRFPGAADINALWKSLCDGGESVSFFALDELDESIPDKLKRDPGYVPACAVLDQPDYFDAGFFGMTPREAQVMDPQQRVLLETAWAALESAGYTPGTTTALTGVFAGTSPNSYWENNLLTRPEIIETYGRYQLGQLNERDYVATRISYKLNLKGPSLTISTACSTSLVAVCVAFQSLQNYECDLALAGGAAVEFPTKQGHLYQEGGIFSPDGHCRPFDKDARGTYIASGAGMVVLKRLSDALADKDDIFAVIKGVGLNNDGGDKVGFTAPSINGQATAIAMAQAIADVGPETISYVEAHGTGTPLGDPIEIEALRKVFGNGPGKTCAIGSIKSNFGHLDAAAGIAGLIKTALALRHRKIPPSLNFSEPNPKINFADSPFYVNAELRDWPQGEGPRRAGVSSFGMGGTNSHVVLEEAPPAPSRDSSPVTNRPLLLLSARSEESLGNLSSALRNALARADTEGLHRTAFTLQKRRKHFQHRRYVVCEDVDHALQMLSAPKPAHCGAAQAAGIAGKPVMMFPGQGCQYPRMGRVLYEREPSFRETIDQCSAISEPIIGESLLDVIYPPAGEEDAAAEKLAQTVFTQPALFALEYALAKQWMKWGVQPAAFIGHSIGELVAAALAGVFEFEDAVKLVAHRGRLMQSTRPGGMLSVRLPEADLRKRLPEGIELAAVNAPALSVAAGDREILNDFELALSSDGVAVSRLRTSHAFHSALMDPIVEEFTGIVDAIKRSPANLPFISSTTGRWITEGEVAEPGYWGRHLRQTVRFADGVRTLLTDDYGMFLECGPRRTLITLSRQIASGSAAVRVVASLDSDGKPDAEDTALTRALGEAWCSGLEIDWEKTYEGDTPRTVFLPGTPFDRKRHFIEPARSGAATTPTPLKEAEAPGTTGNNRNMIEESSTSSAVEAASVSAFNRKEGLSDALFELVTDLSGIAREEMSEDYTFLQIGLDSLLLTQLALAIKNKFQVEISFRDLMDKLGTISDVVAHLDATLPTNAFRPVNEIPAEAVTETGGAAAQVSGGGRNNGEPGGPPVPGARLGRTPEGQPAWFVEDPDRPGKYLQLADSP